MRAKTDEFMTDECMQRSEMPGELRFENEPMLRVCELTHENTIDFQIGCNFSVLNANERMEMKNEGGSHRWRIKLQESKPAEFRYALLKRECIAEKDAEKYVKNFSRPGEDLWWIRKGLKLFIREKMILNGMRYLVIENEWNSREDIFNSVHLYSSGGDVQLVTTKITQARAIFELFNIEYDAFTHIDNRFQILPEDSQSPITIFAPQKNERENNGHSEKRTLKGPLTITVNDSGEIIVVSHLPMEEYLGRYISILLDSELPDEFLKAFAIAKRGELIHAAAEHILEDPFDVIWNRYSGLLGMSKGERRPAASSIINKTRGQVLTCENILCNSLSSPICGGRTESGLQIPGVKDGSYMTGIIDAPNRAIKGYSKNFDKMSNAHKWIGSAPLAYCNRKMNKKIPSKLMSLYNYFRWEYSIPRASLEDIVNKKLDGEVGIIYDLLPISRRSSGHIDTLEILGSLKNTILHGEAQIRSVFDEATLPSTCFEVNSEVGDDGVPIEFTFRGAGLGSGVGMCYAGAIAMASRKMSYRKILTHYFKNVQIKKIY